MATRTPKTEGLRSDQPPANSADAKSRANQQTSCDHADDARNLVLNLDGTANQFSERSTNVVEIFSRLIKDRKRQMVYYDSGIGTYAPPSFRSLSYIKQVLDHAIDTAIAWNFEKIVHAAYEWLSENYEPGDRIFLFGFSRGAYQARVIAGMIETVGLLHRGNKRQIPFAYELYSSVMENTERGEPPNAPLKTPDPSAAQASENTETLDASSDRHDIPTNKPKKPSKAARKRRRKQAKLCRQFKDSLCHENVKVHFVGAWDTVSSIGILRGKALPETVSGMGHVCHFRHALALDERRVKFQPEFANGGLGKQEGDRGDVKEVWFAGSHSDIGGGSIRNKDLKNFGPALRWMTYEAMAHGLLMKRYEGGWSPLPLTKSLTVVWRILEIFPFPSLTYQDANSTTAMYVTLSLWVSFIRTEKHSQGHISVLAGKFSLDNLFITEADSDSDSESNAIREPRGFLPRFLKRRAAITATESNSGLESATTSASRFFRRRVVLTASESNPELESQYGHDASHEPQGLFSRFAEPREKSYLPQAMLPPAFPHSWEDLMDEDRDLNMDSIVEKDPFENASHTLSLLASVSADPAMKWGELPLVMTALRPFATDDTQQHASLLEVPNAGRILLDFVCSALCNPELPISEDSKETLIRLLARTWTISKPLPPSTSLRIPPLTVRRWGSQVSKPRRNDLVMILQPFAHLGYLKEGYNWIQSVAFLLQEPGRIIFTSSPDETTSIFIWDGLTQPRDNIAKVQGWGSTISRDGSHIAVRDGKDASIIDTTTQPPSTAKYTDDEDPNDSGDILSLRFSTNNHTLATGHRNSWIKLWRREGDQWKVIKRFKGGDNWIWRLAFSRDGSRLAFRVSGTSIKVWNSADDAVIELEDSGDSWSLAWSPSGDRIVSGTYDGDVKIWSADRGKITHTFKAHDSPIQCLAFRDDGQVLATGSNDSRIRIWQCDNWEKIWEFDIGEPVLSLAFSPDGKRLVSGGEDGAVHLWDVDMGDEEPVD
ncbi:hypothetical protein ONZ45_g2004 [Pleurotus djamor]|nr:hypothetical protein ONZ45_g2004 [Pleurotus djamor]